MSCGSHPSSVRSSGYGSDTVVIAEEILEEFNKSNIRPLLPAFIPAGEETDQVSIPAGKPKVLNDSFVRGTKCSAPNFSEAFLIS
jgi:hypothetical protein